MSSIPTTGNVIVIAEERKVIINPIAAAGIGLPAGGQLNQALVKNSTADYDTIWSNVVLEVTGDGVDNTDPTRPTLSFPTPDEIGAYSNTNPDGFVDASGAANAAPVQSVNGDTGNVSVFDGGVTGDILVKNSSTNYDTSWTDSITVDKITYDIAAAEALTVEGETAWNADARTLSINKGNDVVQNITQALNYPVSFNADSVPLTKGMLVMADPSQPAQGQSLRIVRYVSNGTYTADLFVGMVIETIPVNELGFVNWFGQVTGLSIPTLQPAGETWQIGDILWPNPAIAGGMTRFEPSAPSHKISAAAIINISGNNANVILRPNLRSKLADLHDVQITNVSNSQILSWNGTAWVNTNNEADGVLSVTGDGVDNTDPQNPVLSFPTVDEIGAYSNTNPDNFVNASGAADAAPIQSVTGDGVDNTNVGNVVISYPTVDDIGAYSNTNPANYINVAQASAAAPIQTVTGNGVDNTNVGNVVISYPTIDDIGAYSNTNPANYINVAQASAAAPVQSVNGQTNVVVLDADDVGAYSNTNPASYINVAQATAAAPIQSVTGTLVTGTSADPVINIPTVDQVGAYSNTNPANYINVAQSIAAAPVQSVNGQTNVVVLNADDVGAYSNTNPSGYVNAVGAAAAAPIQTVTGDGVDNTNVGNVVISFPTLDDIGAYSNTNPANYVNATGAAAAAPVQSVNGQTNVVNLALDDLTDVNVTNATGGQTIIYNASTLSWEAVTIAAGGVQSVTGDGVNNTDPANPVLSFPTLDQIGAYSNTNPDNFVNATGAAAAAPVQSVNGQTNVVVLDADDVGAYSNTNPSNYINVAQASAAAPVQSVNGQTNVVVLGADDVGAYSNTNPANYINVAQAAAAAPVQSVNGQTNVVVLTADDVGAYSNTNPSNYINVAQAAAAAPIQTVTGDGVDNTNVGNVVISYPTVDDIGAYSNTNPANYINVAQASAAAPVQSVNGQTNVVVLTADDVGAYSNTNPASYINVAQAAAAAPIQSVTGTLVTGTTADPVINIPTADQVGAYSNTNPLNFINVAQAADAAPVQSVNGSTGNVNVSVSSLTDTNITNVVDGEVLTYQSGEWINAAGGGGGQTVSNLQIVYLSQVFN